MTRQMTRAQRAEQVAGTDAPIISLRELREGNERALAGGSCD